MMYNNVLINKMISTLSSGAFIMGTTISPTLKEKTIKTKIKTKQSNYVKSKKKIKKIEFTYASASGKAMKIEVFSKDEIFMKFQETIAEKKAFDNVINNKNITITRGVETTDVKKQNIKKLKKYLETEIYLISTKKSTNFNTFVFKGIASYRQSATLGNVKYEERTFDDIFPSYKLEELYKNLEKESKITGDSLARSLKAVGYTVDSKTDSLIGWKHKGESSTKKELLYAEEITPIITIVTEKVETVSKSISSFWGSVTSWWSWGVEPEPEPEKPKDLTGDMRKDTIYLDKSFAKDNQEELFKFDKKQDKLDMPTIISNFISEISDTESDAIYISVKDGIHNSKQVHDKLKDMKEKKIFMILDEDEIVKGAKGEELASGHISSAQYDRKKAVFLAGAQSLQDLLGQKDIETVSYFVGAMNSDKKNTLLAIAFRNGVKSVIKDTEGKTFIKVRFIGEEASKKVGKEVLSKTKTEWERKETEEDTKSELAKHTFSEGFAQADKRIMYIAGSSAKDWRGHDNAKSREWDSTADYGMIGAAYDYKDEYVPSKDQDLSDKEFKGGIDIVLDEAVDSNSELHSLEGKGKDDFERREVKLLGTIGSKEDAEKDYLEKTLKVLESGKDTEEILGKHVKIATNMKTKKEVETPKQNKPINK